MRPRPAPFLLSRPRTLLALLAALLAAPALSPEVVSAQAASAEAARVLLEAAREFEAEQDWDVAEAIYRYIVATYPGTPGADEARARLGAGGQLTSSSGATELQVWSTLYGLWLGIAVPGAFGADDPEPYGAGLILGGPAGFFIGRSVGRSRDLTLGQARAITLGGTWGTLQGFGWREALDLGEEEFCSGDVCFPSGADEEDVFRAGLVGGIAGIVVGATLSRRPIPNATATAANFGAFWGSWVGFASGVVVDLEDDGLLVSTLLAGNAGLAAAALAADDLGWSQNRWRLVSAAGLLGGVVGGGIVLLVQPDTEEVGVGIPLVTSLAGIGLGVGMTRDADRTRGDGPGAGGALLELVDGRPALGTPVPFPTLRPVDGPRGTRWRPAVGITLFRASLR